MAIENKENFTKEEVERLIKKSVSRQKKRTEAKWEYLVKLTAAIVAAVTVLASVVTTKEVMEYINETNMSQEYEEDFQRGISYTASMVELNKKSNIDSDRKQPAIYYEAGPIAEKLVSDGENFDVNFYKTYYTVKNTGSFTDVEIRKTMNQILELVNHYYKQETGNELSESYKKFEKYVISLGYVNDKGEADYKAYSEAFDNYIVYTQRAKDSLGRDFDPSGLGGRK